MSPWIVLRDLTSGSGWGTGEAQYGHVSWTGLERGPPHEEQCVGEELSEELSEEAGAVVGLEDILQPGL